MDHNPRMRNLLAAIHFDRPEWIPCSVSLLPGTWLKYGDEVEAVALDHPALFPNYKPGDARNVKLSRQHQAGRWTDPWGVVWDNCAPGLNAIPVDDEAPLRDWDAFETFSPPDPFAVDDLGNPVDWEKRAQSMAAAKAHGSLASGGLIHGFMFMRLYYLRGFTNFMIDVATRDPRLDRLIDMVLSYNMAIVNKYLELGMDYLSGGDDMGMQTALPIRPDDWVRYLKPCFAQIFRAGLDRGVTTYLHSDGHILEIIPHLKECGLHCINPQVRANTLDGLVDVCKGKICVKLDLDRQLFPFATPDQVREHIHECKDALYMPEGGLMFNAECAPDVPVPIIRAICETLEELGCRA